MLALQERLIGLSLSLSVPLILCGALDAEALLKNLTSKQVQEALKRGADFAEQRRPPNELYWHFGSTEKFAPYGFMVTKVSGLAVMSCHYALRGERPTDQDIQRILEEDMLQVVVIIFGDSFSFARESYLLFQQNGQMVGVLNNEDSKGHISLGSR